MLKRKTPLKRRSGVKKKTSGQKAIESDLHVTYSKMDSNPDIDRFCTGCGATTNLSHSHIISRKDHDLMSDPRNITYHCLPMHDNNGCSSKWEQVGERVYLNDYKVNMEYIKEVRPELFRKMIMDDYYYFQNSFHFHCFPENYSYICRELKQL